MFYGAMIRLDYNQSTRQSVVEFILIVAVVGDPSVVVHCLSSEPGAGRIQALHGTQEQETV